ncbi:hypothetical protein HYS49_03265 [Candidatus Woesearchaeota archaeon]|nr:hypothetical protein [Candidatus Woesearchaeota archaeon]
MPLSQTIVYERTMKPLGNIPSESVPGEVLSLLQDVRSSIGKVEPSFGNASLTRVLEAGEAGEYRVEGSIGIRIDLSSAKSAIEAYREYSEGGCQSCVNLGRETIDAQDATSGWYCRVADPDYDKGSGVRYSGFSPKVRRHYATPCESWKPRFSPRLEELVQERQVSGFASSTTSPS